MEIRGKNFYKEYYDEIDYINTIFKNEELTPDEAKIVANLNMQKAKIEAEIKRREQQIEKIQKEIELYKNNILQIEKRIKSYEL